MSPLSADGLSGAITARNLAVMDIRWLSKGFEGLKVAGGGERSADGVAGSVEMSTTVETKGGGGGGEGGAGGGGGGGGGGPRKVEEKEDEEEEVEHTNKRNIHSPQRGRKGGKTSVSGLPVRSRDTSFLRRLQKASFIS